MIAGLPMSDLVAPFASYKGKILMLPPIPKLSSDSTSVESIFTAAPVPSLTEKQQAIVNEVLSALSSDQLDLPVLPDMALKIQALLEDPDSSIGQFVQLISTDLGVILHIMKAANIAAFSNGQRVSNLNDAILRLGYRMLYSIIMNITLTKLFQAESAVVNDKLAALWEYSREVAANCYVLAQKNKYLKPEDAMLAGLIHDIGALPLYLYADRHYPEIDPATLENLAACRA
jgi:HD-like signal output (HDOD) protein